MRAECQSHEMRAVARSGQVIGSPLTQRRPARAALRCAAGRHAAHLIQSFFTPPSWHGTGHHTHPVRLLLLPTGWRKAMEGMKGWLWLPHRSRAPAWSAWCVQSLTSSSYIVMIAELTIKSNRSSVSSWASSMRCPLPRVPPVRQGRRRRGRRQQGGPKQRLPRADCFRQLGEPAAVPPPRLLRGLERRHLLPQPSHLRLERLQQGAVGISSPARVRRNRACTATA